MRSNYPSKGNLTKGAVFKKIPSSVFKNVLSGHFGSHLPPRGEGLWDGTQAVPYRGGVGLAGGRLPPLQGERIVKSEE